MELRYDSFYDEEKIYKISFEELSKIEYKSDEVLLAFIRNCGFDKVRFLVKVSPPKDITKTPFGFALCGSEKVKSVCKMVDREGGNYNPLTEDNNHDGHWYHPYKILFTSVEFEGVVEHMYFSCLCSLVRRGDIEIWECEDEI